MGDKKNPDFSNYQVRKTSFTENLLTLRRRRSTFIRYITGLNNKIGEKLPLKLC